MAEKKCTEYIEREVALNNLAKSYFAGVLDDLIHAEDAVNAVPAADVVEVRHAKDVYRQYNEHHCEFMCSLCGGWIGVIEGGNCDFNYCPNCGAKMEGEKDES